MVLSRTEAGSNQDGCCRLESAVAIAQLHTHRIGKVKRSDQVLFPVAVDVGKRGPDGKSVCPCAGGHLRQQRGGRCGGIERYRGGDGITGVTSVNASCPLGAVKPKPNTSIVAAVEVSEAIVVCDRASTLKDTLS